MSRPLLVGGWAYLLLLVLLFQSRKLHCSAANTHPSRPSFRYAIKINSGAPPAMPTPEAPSHTFRLPDPNLVAEAGADTPSTPHNQANAIRATKTPGYKPPPQPLARAPANFTIPPALLPEWSVSTVGGEGGAAVDARFDAVYEGALWRRLDGDCMYARLDEYRYELCPFHNVTQRALRKNSLSVALGSAALKNANCIKVWSSWWTTSDHQLAMNYTDGASCNEQLNRSTTVMLHCSAPRSIAQSTAPLPPIDTLAEYSPSYIAAVDEPSTCTYRMHWYTPLVCSVYRIAAEERSSGAQQQQSSPAPEAVDKQERHELVERRSLLARELEFEDEVGGAKEVSLAAQSSAEVRGYLDCIAAMTASSGTADSCRAACAAYLPSKLPEQSGVYEDNVT